MTGVSHSFIAVAVAVAIPVWIVGCAPPAKEASKGGTDTHAAEQNHDAGNHAADQNHEDQPLTDKDVQLPANFKAGVGRLDELSNKIGQLIEQNKLGDVHRAAEEMALVARKMKELAAKDLPAEKQTEAGRLCNEIAGYFRPIDAAADAGNKDETSSIHQQMGKTLEKLKALAP